MLLVVVLQFAASVFAETSNADCRFNSLPRCEGGNLAATNSPAQIVFLPRVKTAFSARQLGDVLEAAATTGTYVIGRTLQIDSLLAEADCNEPCRAKLRKYRDRILKGIPTVVAPEAQTQYDRDTYFSGTSGGKFQVWNDINGYEGTSQVTLCGKKVQVQPGAFSSDPNRGGNVLMLPGGTCLVGDQSSPAFRNRICGEGGRQLPLSTGSAKLPHIDNSIGIVPVVGERPPCNFRVMMASNDRMQEHLLKHPNDPFFDPQRTDEFFKRGDTYKRANPFWGICSSVRRFKAFKKIQSHLTDVPANPPAAQPARTTGWLNIDSLISYVLPRAEAFIKRQTREEAAAENAEAEKFPFLAEAQSALERIDYEKSPDCEGITNADVAALFDIEKELAPLMSWSEARARDLPPLERQKSDSLMIYVQRLWAEGKARQAFQNTQDENWKKILAALPAQCRMKGNQMRGELPALFLDGNSVNANPSNVQVIGNMVLIPMQPNPMLGEAVKAQYQKLGLKTEEINTLDAHAGMGNVHCLSNEFRVCR